MIDIELCNRFTKAVKDSGFTQSTFAKKLDIRRASLSEIKNYKMEPTINIIKKLVRISDINLNWLLTGEGPMFLEQASTKPKPEVELNVDKLQHYIDIGKAKAHQEIISNHEDVNYKTLPITGEIAAGNPIEIRDVDILGKILVSADIIDDIANFYCFRVNGWSMSPEVQHGDIVIISKIYDWEDLDNRIVAVRIDDGVTLKVIKIDHDNQCSWLMPINDDYKPILLNEYSTVVMLGVMEYLIRSYK